MVIWEFNKGYNSSTISPHSETQFRPCMTRSRFSSLFCFELKVYKMGMQQQMSGHLLSIQRQKSPKRKQKFRRNLYYSSLRRKGSVSRIRTLKMEASMRLLHCINIKKQKNWSAGITKPQNARPSCAWERERERGVLCYCTIFYFKT